MPEHDDRCPRCMYTGGYAGIPLLRVGTCFEHRNTISKSYVDALRCKQKEFDEFIESHEIVGG